jgi:tetratricopeptide (TPR) repeat protein
MLVGAHARLDAADRRAGDELAELVARCLAIDPAQRPTASELAAAVDAQNDWTDAPAAERAAVVSDARGYQARIAELRVRRLERLAREALTAGKPFVTLAYCDRGLAYAPEHAGLLALVAEAETATATRPMRAKPVPRSPRSKWPYVIAFGLAIWFAALTIYVIVPDRKPPPPQKPSLSLSEQMSPGDRELLGDFLHVFDKAITKSSSTGSAALGPGEPPTTAAGWLELSTMQSPAEAVGSIRHALALSPTWLDAQVALCAALALSKDAGAVAACDVALKRKPDDVGLLAARGAALLHAGDAKAALVDLDKAVGLDPEPKWKRLRARAREAVGDHAGAQHDLDHACQLGDAAACTEKL